MKLNNFLTKTIGLLLTITLFWSASLALQTKPTLGIIEQPPAVDDAEHSATVANGPSHLPSSLRAEMMAPSIEIAPKSGVSGYEIGIFGSEFGVTAGSVTILGQPATINEWTSTFISVEIPAVADGTGDLIIATANAQSVSQSFEVYTINPIFQRGPRNRFVNVLRGKPAVIQNIDDGYCYKQPNSIYTEPSEFLTDFACGFSGIIGDGEVIVNIPWGQSTAISVDLVDPLEGTYYFQYFSGPNWYAYWDLYPQAYQIQVSADSTDGLNGTWQTVHDETTNDRGSRLHKIEVPAGDHHWIRMNISSGTNGPRVKLKEIRLYQSTNAETSDLDIVTIYGDSNTEGAFYHIGSTGFSLSVSDKSASVDEPIFIPFGLPGQESTGLIEQLNINYDIYDAFAMDQLGDRARYWGISLGGNDLGLGANDLGVPGTHLEEFDERTEAIVQYLISQNKVPMLARLSDNIEATGTDVLATKKKILEDIDQIAATYRLIPGPDLYTPVRLNIERDNGSWFWPGDPDHLNWTGRLVAVDAWAEAFVQGTNRPTMPLGMEPPGIVTQIGPVGDIPTASPNFVWEAQPTATGYIFLLYRVDTNEITLMQEYAGVDICGQTECSVQPFTDPPLPEAEYTWMVKAVNAAGHAVWSSYSE